MFRHSSEPQPRQDTPATRTVRVLRSSEELAEASARAAEHARRLEDRLESRAARDAWMAGRQADSQVSWLRFSGASATVPVAPAAAVAVSGATGAVSGEQSDAQTPAA